MNKEDIRIISYVTENYKRQSNKLPVSLEKAGLKFTCFGVSDAKAVIDYERMFEMTEFLENRLWNVNTNHKPFMIRNALDLFDEPIIWWTDWDSSLEDPEELIRQTQLWYDANDHDIFLNKRVQRGGRNITTAVH